MVSQKLQQYPENKPRFFYGYIVVSLAFLIMVIAQGLNTAFGVFFNPLLAEFNWTRAMISGAFSLSAVIHGVLGIIMGGLTDRFGPRIVITLCGLVLGLGYLLMSQLGSLWQFYLFFGVIVGIGMSGMWVPLLSPVARWFVKRRSLMSGIVVGGIGIGGLVTPPIISRLITAYDWRLSYVIAGVVVLLVIVLAAQFMRRDPTQMGQQPYGETETKQHLLKFETKAFSLKEAIFTAQFWLVLIILFCFGYCVFSVMVHIVPHATELGISAVTGANILASMNGISLLGNVGLGGIFGDRIGSRRVFIIGFIMASAAFFWLMMARDIWTLYLFAAVFGIALGALGASESPLVARLFGVSSHGVIFGVIGLGFTGGSAVGPFLTGYIFDITGSYNSAFLVCASIAIIGIILASILKPIKKLGARL